MEHKPVQENRPERFTQPKQMPRIASVHRGSRLHFDCEDTAAG